MILPPRFPVVRCFRFALALLLAGGVSFAAWRVGAHELPKQWGASPPNSVAAKVAPRAVAPWLAAAVPVTITVDSTLHGTDANAASTTLVEAIQQANAAGGATVIELATGATYASDDTLFLDNSAAGRTMYPAITAAITIRGNGATLDATGKKARFFFVSGSGSLTLEDLNLVGGNAQGGDGSGGKFAGGGGGAGMGGAVFVSGATAALTMRRASITSCVAKGGAGAISSVFPGPGGGGGGMGGNGADSGGGGPRTAAAGNSGGDGVGGNGGANNGGFGGGGGGGIEPSNAGNGGFGGGGGGGWTNLPKWGNPGAGGFGGGGGGWTNAFPGAGGAGGAFGGVGGTYASSGFAAGGGGAGLGGAIFNYQGAVTLENVTMIGNSATGGLGNAFNGVGAGSGAGGAVFNYDGAVTMTHITASGNTVATGADNPGIATGGTLYNYDAVGGATPTVAIYNSILANSTFTNYASGKEVFNSGSGSITAAGLANTSLIASATGLTGTVLTANPALGLLERKSGIIIARPQTGSPALDAGDAANSLATDATGTARPSGAGVDIGAAEGAFASTLNLTAGMLLVTDTQADAVFALDPANGNRTLVSKLNYVGTGPDIGNPRGIVADANKNIYVVNTAPDIAIVKIDPVTGNRTTLSSSALSVGTGPAFSTPSGITMRPADGKLLVTDTGGTNGAAGGDAIFVVDPTTGNRTILSDDVTPNATNALTTANTILYHSTLGLLVTDNTTNDSVMRVNDSTGARTVFSSSALSVPNATNPFVNPFGLAEDTDGSLLLVESTTTTGANRQLLRLSKTDGARTVVSNLSTTVALQGLAAGTSGIYVVKTTAPAQIQKVNANSGVVTPFSGNTVGDGVLYGNNATGSIGFNIGLAIIPGATAASAPTVASPTSTNLAATSATLGGNVTSDGGANITERGIVYSPTAANSDPQMGGVNVTKVTSTGTTGVFMVNVSSLTASTGYSFKAYATNNVGTSYSTTGTFATLAPPNTAPTITAASGVARQQGAAASNAAIATVNDTESGANGVVVTVTSANPANGVTLSNLTNTNGTITANLAADCTATNASFTLHVSDGTLTAMATLNVTVSANTPPVLSYSTQNTTYGNALTINPFTGPSDNMGIASLAVISSPPSAGTIAVNSAGVVSVSNDVPAGDYTVTIRALDACGGANGTTDASFTLTVNKATPVITWANPVDIAYGTALSATQLNATANVLGTFNYTQGTGTVLSAGVNQMLNASFTPADPTNYTNTIASVAINVLKTTLTVKAVDANKVYGAANPTFTVSYSGFVGNDDPSSLGGALVFSTTATTSSAVGDYTIAPSGLTATNYAITFANGTLSVAKAPLSITTDNQTRVYGTANPSFTGSVTGLVNSDNIAVTWTTTATETSVPGTYPITPVIIDPGSKLDNYNVSSSNGTLTVTCPTITLAALLSGTLNTSYKATLSANPVGDSYTFSGTAPAGLTLASNGALTGTPNATGTFTFNVTVNGLGSCSQVIPVSLTINCPTIAIAPATLPNAEQGTAYSQSLSATPSGTTYGFTVTSGALPAGLTLGSNGTLSGTPMASGTFNFTVTATGFSTCTGTRAYLLVVTDCSPITVNPASLTSGTLGTAYSQTITASGSTGPYAFSIASGVLPTGLTLASNGALNGTPTQAGTFTVTIKAATAAGCNGQRAYTFSIACPTIVLSPASLPNAGTGVSYRQQLTASPSLAYTYSVSAGALPTGMTLSNEGLLSGTPTKAGAYTFTVQATSSTCAGTRSYTLTVRDCKGANINLRPSTLSNGKVGATYSQTFSATPASNTYNFIVTNGALPPGLTLAAATGVLSGTPTTAGTFSFTITALATTGCASGVNYTMTIAAAALAARAVTNDFDGDGKSDLVNWEPTTGQWTIIHSSDGSREQLVFGSEGDVPVAADYDGDGRADVAVFHPTRAEWSVRLSTSGAITITQFGTAAATPVVADYDGDGKVDFAVRETTGRWRIRQSSDDREQIFQLGAAQAVAMAADYDGDGRADATVFEVQLGVWRIRLSESQTMREESFGERGDVPLPGDFDGDGKADLAVLRAADGAIRLRCSSDQETQGWTDLALRSGGRLTVGDYDGDGVADYVVWRKAERQWYWRPSGRQDVLRRALEFVPVPRQ